MQESGGRTELRSRWTMYWYFVVFTRELKIYGTWQGGNPTVVHAQALFHLVKGGRDLLRMNWMSQASLRRGCRRVMGSRSPSERPLSRTFLPLPSV